MGVFNDNEPSYRTSSHNFITKYTQYTEYTTNGQNNKELASV